jgi:hypothetical protein
LVTNKNDFALQQITLRCDYGTRDGPKVVTYQLSEVIEPARLLSGAKLAFSGLWPMTRAKQDPPGGGRRALKSVIDSGG